MNKMIARCGLDCAVCPALLATRANDEAKIQQIAREWATQFGVNVAASDVWCDGCIAGGEKCAHCHECEVRACAIAKGAANCAHCGEMDACAKIQGLFKMAPAAKANLERIRDALTA
jgi:hypothetical protein